MVIVQLDEKRSVTWVLPSYLYCISLEAANYNHHVPIIMFVNHKACRKSSTASRSDIYVEGVWYVRSQILMQSDNTQVNSIHELCSLLSYSYIHEFLD